MSKAFTKETETEAAVPDAPDPLPKGVKNYVTPNGLRLLRDELDHLRRVERPKVVEVVAWAAANGDRSENGDYIYGKKRLREIDRRLRFLMKRIESAEVVDPARQKNHDRVFFGATVTYVDADGGFDDEGEHRAHRRHRRGQHRARRGQLGLPDRPRAVAGRGRRRGCVKYSRRCEAHRGREDRV